ncbi:MAG: cytidine deaminase [Clostridia bacterium]|nr:cytidine deaminase [Clostridia bacterium]
MNKKDLFNLAKEAMKNSYAPYSNYNVGAVLLCENGNIYKGCNVENASYSTTNCAERTALFSAVTNGEKDFEAICVVGGKNGEITDYAMPCGVCRQVLAEFCDADFKVYVGVSEDDIKEYKLCDLLPYSFDKSKLGD